MSDLTPREAADIADNAVAPDEFPTTFDQAVQVLVEHARAITACPCCDGDPLTVCDACGRHACWAGRLMCDESATAGTRQARAISPSPEGGDLAEVAREVARHLLTYQVVAASERRFLADRLIRAADRFTAGGAS